MRGVDGSEHDVTEEQPSEPELAGVDGVRAAEKGLELLFGRAREVPRVVRGDPLRLGQVLLNLTNNAIKFTERGEIVVRVDLESQDRDGVVLGFSVRDTGPG